MPNIELAESAAFFAAPRATSKPADNFALTVEATAPTREVRGSNAVASFVRIGSSFAPTFAASVLRYSAPTGAVSGDVMTPPVVAG